MSLALDHELAALRRSSRKQLIKRWRELCGAAPPAAYTPDLLARGIAWRLQERALGDLSSDARRRLDPLDEKALKRTPSSRATLRPGNRLVRRWRGRTFVVEVTEVGLVFDGEKYSSLSVIAGQITGTRWSGPKFFGLVK